jgi:hypothetical protein
VHTDVNTAAARRKDGDDTAPRRTVRDGQRKVGELVARAAESAAAPARDCFPSLARWLASQAAMARRRHDMAHTDDCDLGSKARHHRRKG